MSDLSDNTSMILAYVQGITQQTFRWWTSIVFLLAGNVHTVNGNMVMAQYWCGSPQP